MAPGFRFDRYDLKPSHRTDEGFLICEAAVAKPGILPYRMDDGSIRREFVPKETLKQRSDLASLGLKPVTDGHPDRPLDPATARDSQVGSVGNEVEFRENNGLVTVKMALHDEDAIEAAESGKRDDGSPGYKVQTDESPGTFKGQRYDAVQVSRRYNHYAICEQARAGSGIGVRADAAGEELSGFRFDEAGADWTVGMMERADALGGALRQMVNLAVDFATSDGMPIEALAEEIAGAVEQTKSDVFHMLRGDFEPSDAVVSQLSERAQIDEDLFRRAAAMSNRGDALDATTVVFTDGDADDGADADTDDSEDREDSDVGGMVNFRRDATINDPGNLPMAPVDRDWDVQRAQESLYEFYEVDPREDTPPPEYHENWLYVAEGADGEFTEGHSYLVVEAIEGERHIVPQALIAAAGFLSSTENSGLPADDLDNVRNIVAEHWRRVWEDVGEDGWPDPEPPWARDENGDGDEQGDSLSGDGNMTLIEKFDELLADRFDDAAAEGEIPEAFADFKADLEDLMEAKQTAEKKLQEKKQQLKGVMKSLDMDLGSAPDAGGDEPDADGGDSDADANTPDEEDGERGDSVRFTSEDEIREWHNKRRELEDYAERFNIDGVADMSNADLRRAIVAEANGDDLEDWRDDATTKGAFRVLKRRLDSRDEEYQGLSERANNRRDAGGANTLEKREEEANEEYLEHLTGAGE